MTDKPDMTENLNQMSNGKGTAIVPPKPKSVQRRGYRLLHCCHIIPTSGPSYRIKDKLENLKKRD